MKKNLCKIIALSLILVFMLAACGGESKPEDIVKKQLASGTWYADMSMGTTAGYTFQKDGSFTCDTAVTLEGQSVSLTRGGTYEILPSGEGVMVALAFAEAGYLVEITCTENGDGFDFEIAGCAMYQK